MRVIPFAVFAVSCFAAAPTKFTAAVTAQQAILRWDQTYAGTCTVEVSESATYSPVVNDVNVTLFTGSATTTAGAGSQTFIVGKRSAETAIDGKIYSRSLAAATPHYVRLNCDGEFAYLTFTTARAAGITPEAPLWNADGFGNMAIQEFDFTDGSKPVIDAQVGAKIYRVSGPTDMGFSAEYSFPASSVQGASGWTSASNLVSGSPSTLAVTGNTNAAFAPIQVDGNSRTFGGFVPPGPNTIYAFTLSNLGFRIYGEGSDGTASNRQVAVCLSTDSGQTCATDEITLNLSASGSCPGSCDQGVLPATHADGGWLGWSSAIPKTFHMMQGYVTASASSTVTLVGGLNTSANLNGQQASPAWFRPEWAAGSKIYIAGTDPTCPNNYCTLVSVTDRDTLVIQETITVSAALYRFGGLGFRVRKTNATGTVSLSMKYTTQAGYALQQGQAESCSPKAVTTSVDRNGSPLGYTEVGYLCLFNSMRDAASLLYFVSADRHDYRLLDLIAPPSSISGYTTDDLPTGAGFTAGPSSAGATFDPADGNSFYTLKTCQASGNPPCLWKITYTGSGYVEPAGIHNSLNVAGAISGYTSPLTWANLTRPTQGRSLSAQILANTTYDTAVWPALTGLGFNGITGGYAQFSITISGQDLPGAVFLFDSTGTFYSWSDGLSNALPGNRFIGLHASSPTAGLSVISSHTLIANDSSKKFGGPFSSSWNCVMKGGVCDTDTSLPGTIGAGYGYDATCPSGLPSWAVDMGATGDQCVTMQTTGEPCSATPQTVELANFPCPNSGAATKSWIGVPVDLKDTIYDNVDATPQQFGAREFMILVKKTNLGGELWEMVFLRDSATGYACQEAAPRGRKCDANASQAAHLDNWTARWTPASDYPIFTPSTNIWAQENQYLTRGHADRSLSFSGVPSFVGIYGSGGYFSRLGGSIGGQATAYLAQWPFFAGIEANADGAGGWQQSYLSASPLNGVGVNAELGADWRHPNGSFGSEPEVLGATIGDSYTLTLQGGTTSVYKVATISGDYNPKKTQITAWVGPYILKEKSSTTTGNTITDSDPWRVCYAYKANECRTGSTAGDFYVVAPALQTTMTQCNSSQTSVRNLCLFASTAVLGRVTQVRFVNDATGILQRHLGDTMTSPGAQYAYSHARTFPDGTCVMSSTYNAYGWWSGVTQICPGPWIEDSANRTGFQPVPVKATFANAVVEFGYDANFYCTPRAEACKVAASTINATTPFYFAHETLAGVTGSATITIPALPSRILYYRVISGSTPGPTQILAVP